MYPLSYSPFDRWCLFLTVFIPSEGTNHTTDAKYPSLAIVRLNYPAPLVSMKGDAIGPTSSHAHISKDAIETAFYNFYILPLLPVVKADVILQMVQLIPVFLDKGRQFTRVVHLFEKENKLIYINV